MLPARIVRQVNTEMPLLAHVKFVSLGNIQTWEGRLLVKIAHKDVTKTHKGLRIANPVERANQQLLRVAPLQQQGLVLFVDPRRIKTPQSHQGQMRLHAKLAL